MRALGVIVALEVEAAAILDDGYFDWEGRGEGRFKSRKLPLRLQFCGVGKVLASWACAGIAKESDLILSLGAAGGLGSERLGSLWLVPEFVEHDMDLRGLGLSLGVTAFAGHDAPVYRTVTEATMGEARSSLRAAGLDFNETRLATGDVFISDGDRARALARATGARLCDMESAAIAKLCSLRAVNAAGNPMEYFALRAISDNADHLAGSSWSEQAKRSSIDLALFLKEFVGRL